MRYRVMNTRSLTPLAIAMVVSSLVGAIAWVSVKTQRPAMIDVTGSAKRRIVSDLIEWQATLTAETTDRVQAYRTLQGYVEKTTAYLKQQGIADADVSTTSVSTEETFDNVVTGSGEERNEKMVPKGWLAVQSVLVRSNDVKTVERVSREVTKLIEQGVPVTSQQPSYLYTKLGELKIEMLAEAGKDARTRAERILAAAGNGSKAGRLDRVEMGVINVNPANSTETSWQGNNDTTSLDKDIITIVRVGYRIDN
jgi:uncharacterized protein